MEVKRPYYASYSITYFNCNLIFSNLIFLFMFDISKIGADAGTVYNVLSKNGEQTIKALRRQTKLKDKELLLALGWLSREDKVEFKDVEDDCYVALV